jgi:hypothetical protein
VLDVLLEPQKLDMGETAHVPRPPQCGRTDCSRPGLLVVHSRG